MLLKIDWKENLVDDVELALYIEQLEGLGSRQYDNTKDLEHISDLLDVAIINLRK